MGSDHTFRRLCALAVSLPRQPRQLTFYQRHHKEDVVVGSTIGFSCAWLIYHVYFSSPFTPISGQIGNTAREVYTSSRDESVELQRIPEEEEPLHPDRNRASQDV